MSSLWGWKLATVATSLPIPAWPEQIDCWADCRLTGFYCEDFCCQPPDGIGNPTCWDPNEFYTFEKCCKMIDPEAEEGPAPMFRLGSVVVPLYRGPSDYNSPRFNERTLEVALGLWFARRALKGPNPLIEVGNVLSWYWPGTERPLPWYCADLQDTGVDASAMFFSNLSVLSISTVEHIGFDNEGLQYSQGVRFNTPDASSLQPWVTAWNDGATLLKVIAGEARQFLVTFPIGFNPRLDAVIQGTPRLRRLARVARRVDVGNRWEVDETGSFNYGYDLRDTYSSNHLAQIYSRDRKSVV